LDRVLRSSYTRSMREKCSERFANQWSYAVFPSCVSRKAQGSTSMAFLSSRSHHRLSASLRPHLAGWLRPCEKRLRLYASYPGMIESCHMYLAILSSITFTSKSLRPGSRIEMRLVESTTYSSIGLSILSSLIYFLE
jgi:hypothetical protein